MLLVAKKESGISKLEDFPGKKVSMWYTGTQYIVRAMLKNKGIDPASITGGAAARDHGPLRAR